MRQNTSLNSKQRQRKENKKRKMSALYTISCLNEEDRMKAMMKSGAHIPFKQEVHENDIKQNESRKRKFEEIAEDGVRGNPVIEKRQLSEEELKELRILIYKRAAAKKNLPKISLKLPGLQALIDHPQNHRVPLFLSDIQHFILYSLHGHMTTGNIPRWINIEKYRQIKKVLFLVVEGMSLTDYNNHEHLCPKLKEFPHKFEVVTPLAYGGYLIREMATLPLTESQRHKLEKKFGSMAEAESNNRVFKALRTMFPLGFKTKAQRPKGNHAFSRTELMLSPWQMLEEGYPFLLDGELKTKYGNFVYTKDTYREVTSNSPMWALDCEMCVTKAGSELTRLTVINEHMEVVYETHVKPYNPIIDYVTRFSGVTAKHLENVQTRIEDVQSKLREIIPPDLILIGHSLNMDLQALKMLHPYCIDTSVIFNLSGDRARKTKLKVLSAEFLGEQIQCSIHGHDSDEDAKACMKLVLAKLQHSLEWGDAVISGPRAVEEILFNARLKRMKDNELKKVNKKENNSTIIPDSAENDPLYNNNNVPVVRLHNSLPKYVKGDSVVQVNMFTTSLFTHLITREKKCLLVARSSVANEFVKYIPEHLRPFQPESRVTISTQETNKAIVKFGRNNSPESGATIMYNIVERKPEQTAVKVDQLVKKLTKAISGNVLVAVLLAGRTTAFDEVDTSNHGMLLVHLHQEYVPPVQLENDKRATTTLPVDCETVC